ncbi:hypothetical protein F2Q69_00063521 [Brassica cretica]|uniref:Uncharacterized protein n=1 Tax=Brassica cretica TaxID=69181 RepID=A0A8S9RE50_BRACR|nr:hypothetical protein F2Q69_00063521 [Brassica cretica]
MDLHVLIHEMVEKGMTPPKACMATYVILIGEMVGNGMMAPSKACMDLHVLIHEMVEKGMTGDKACMATYVILRQEMVGNGMMTSSEACEDLYLIIHEMLEKGMTPLPEALSSPAVPGLSTSPRPTSLSEETSKDSNPETNTFKMGTASSLSTLLDPSSELLPCSAAAWREVIVLKHVTVTEPALVFGLGVGSGS